MRALDGDAALLQRLCALWLEEAPRQHAALQEAIHTGDAATVHRVAHAWKNSAGTLQLKRVHAVCTTLEKARPEEWAALLHKLDKANRESLDALRAL